MICCIVSCDQETIVEHNEPFLKELTNDIYYINSKQGNYCTFHSIKSHEERWKEALFLIIKPYTFFIFMTDKMFITGSLFNYTQWSIKRGHTVFQELKMISYKDMMKNTTPIHATQCPAYITVNDIHADIVKDIKDIHRKKCIEELSLIENIPLPPLIVSEKETILIEFRILPHLNYLIRNMRFMLPLWSHTIVCGKINQIMFKEWFPDMNIICLPIDNIKPSEYSKLLFQPSFWKLFLGETLLIYQEDSMMFHNKIEPFLKYDWVGAPWPTNQDDNAIGVGNGGFSLRKKSVLLKCLETVPHYALQLGNSTLEYMKNTNSYVLPEDVYFSKVMIDYQLGNVAPREVALHFSQETQKSISPLGGHQYWLAGNIPFPGIVLGTDYYSSVIHRGGWKTIISYFIRNNVFRNEGTLLIDCMENYFMWNNKTCRQPWVGIAHYSILPTYHSLTTLVNLDTVKKSLPYCKGIIVLSKHNLHVLPNVPTIALKHPITINSKSFSMSHFLTCAPSVIQLGSQDRITTFIDELKTTYPKKWMPGKKGLVSTVPIEYVEDYEEYDSILCSNIIVIPLVASSANNSILEIIAMNIPAFVSRLPSTEEYLGKDYPMFFQTKEEVEDILNHEKKMHALYKKTHDYLKKMNKSDLSMVTFQTNVIKFCLY